MNKAENVTDVKNEKEEMINKFLPIMEDSAEKIKEIGLDLLEEFKVENKRKDALTAINALWKSSNIYKILIDIKTK